MQNTIEQGESRTLSPTFWMLLPLLLLVTSVSGWLYMVSLAVNDPGFAVEPDYYEKAARYDEVLAQKAQDQRLAYRVEVVSFKANEALGAHLLLRLWDASEKPLSSRKVEAQAYFIRRASHGEQLVFEEQEPGTYLAQIPRSAPGLWEVRLTVLGDKAERFTELLRLELHRNDPRGTSPLPGQKEPPT